MQKAGSRMGTGTMIVLDDQTCPVGMVWNLEHFFRRNPAACVPPAGRTCPGGARILARWKRDEAPLATWRNSYFRRAFSRPGHTFCALPPGAAEPLQSGLKYFREDFDRHIREKRCPWR